MSTTTHRTRRRRVALTAALSIIIGTVAVVQLTGADAAPRQATGTSIFGDLWPIAASPSARTTSMEVGLQFVPNATVKVVALRFFKAGGKNHVATLWDATGRALASTSFRAETASGWQRVDLRSPVVLAAGATYVVSYHVDNASYQKTDGYFGPTPTQFGTVLPAKGVFRNGPKAFPNQVTATNFWVDVVYQVDTSPPPPTTTVVPAPTTTVVPAPTTTVVPAPTTTVAPAPTTTVVPAPTTTVAPAPTTTVAPAPTTTVAPAPTTTVAPTTTTTAPPPAPAGACTETLGDRPGGPDGFGGCWPSAATTGVPAGTPLTVVNGNLTVSTAGAVIDGKDIRGCVMVNAPNVTIRNSKVTCTSGSYAIDYYPSGAGTLTIQDSEVTCAYRNATGIGEKQFVALRVHVYGCENGFDVDRDATIQDSYVHDMYEGASGHGDGVQSCCGVNLTFRHNTLFPGAKTTSAIITPPSGSSNFTIDRNLMAGGAATLYCPRDSSTNFRVTQNRFSKYYYPTGGAYMPWTDCGKVAVNTGNVWAITLVPLNA